MFKLISETFEKLSHFGERTVKNLNKEPEPRIQNLINLFRIKITQITVQSRINGEEFIQFVEKTRETKVPPYMNTRGCEFAPSFKYFVYYGTEFSVQIPENGEILERTLEKLNSKHFQIHIYMRSKKDEGKQYLLEIWSVSEIDVEIEDPKARNGHIDEEFVYEKMKMFFRTFKKRVGNTEMYKLALKICKEGRYQIVYDVTNHRKDDLLLPLLGDKNTVHTLDFGEIYLPDLLKMKVVLKYRTTQAKRTKQSFQITRDCCGNEILECVNLARNAGTKCVREYSAVYSKRNDPVKAVVVEDIGEICTTEPFYDLVIHKFQQKPKPKVFQEAVKEESANVVKTYEEFKVEDDEMCSSFLFNRSDILQGPFAPSTASNSTTSSMKTTQEEQEYDLQFFHNEMSLAPRNLAYFKLTDDQPTDRKVQSLADLENFFGEELGIFDELEAKLEEPSLPQL